MNIVSSNFTGTIPQEVSVKAVSCFCHSVLRLEGKSLGKSDVKDRMG